MIKYFQIIFLIFIGSITSFPHNSFSQIIPTACNSATYTLNPGTSIMFYDDGGPGGNCASDGGAGNYANANCETVTTICSAPGEVLSVSFSVFSMYNTGSGWDWMVIYDGPDMSSPILFDNRVGSPDITVGTDCTYDGNSLAFCASSGCLTFRFYATSVVNKAGWEAIVSSNNSSNSPTFNQVPPICAGEQLAPLPTTSINGITGTWSPALNNMATTTYTFTPNPGQCSPSTTMTIEVHPLNIPTFTQVDPICAGEPLAPLPTTSLEGISGTWSPAINNMATTTYTFTPNATQCADTYTMTIEVYQAPTFTQVPDICIYEPLYPLPTTSLEGIQGTWSPALDNTTTTTYTFTPNSGQCNLTQDMTITVNPLPTATIDGTIAVCKDGNEPTITFTGANGTAPYTFTYSINNGPEQNVTSTGDVATITAPTTTVGTYNYDLISVQDASSTACSNAQFGTATVTVNPLPSATISENKEACQFGEDPSITFTGTGGTSPYTFTYIDYLGNTQTVSSNAQGIATITTPTDIPGTYDISLISVQDASPITCSSAVTGQNAVITVHALPDATITGINEICQKEEQPFIIFEGIDGLTNNYIFTYSLNDKPEQTISSIDGTAQIGVSTTNKGSYTYKFISVEDPVTGCSQLVNESHTINVLLKPKAAFTANPKNVTTADWFSQMKNLSENADSYLWDFGDGTSSTEFEVLHEFPSDMPGTYNVKLSAFTDEGCSDTAVVIVTVSEDLIYYIPNSFTPDQNYFNEKFKPIFFSGFDKSQYTFQIFNRWGELIFESHDTEIGWDGTYGVKGGGYLSEGVYIWKITVGVIDTDEIRTLEGHVNLLR